MERERKLSEKGKRVKWGMSRNLSLSLFVLSFTIEIIVISPNMNFKADAKKENVKP